MKARELLYSLEFTEPNQVMKLPAAIDLGVDKDAMRANEFWDRINEVVIHKNPSYIEVAGWQAIEGLHILDYYEPLHYSFIRLLTLPVQHIHFNFSDIDGIPNLANRILHNFKYAYADSLRIQRPRIIDHIFNDSSAPILTYQADTVLHPEVAEEFSKLMQYAKIHPALTRLAYARIHIQKNDFDEALRCYAAAIDIYPEFSRIYYARAMLHQMRNDSQAALNDFRQTIACESKTSRNLEVESSAYLHSAKIMMCSNRYNNLLKAAILFAKVNKKTSSYVEASEHLQRLVERFYRYAVKHAALPFSSEHMRAALDGFAHAIKFSCGKFRDANFARANLYLKYYQLPEFQTLVGLDSQRAVIEEANRDYESVIENYPSSRRALTGISRCQKILADLNQSRPAYGRLFNVSRSNAVVSYVPSALDEEEDDEPGLML